MQRLSRIARLAGLSGEVRQLQERVERTERHMSVLQSDVREQFRRTDATLEDVVAALDRLRARIDELESASRPA